LGDQFTLAAFRINRKLLDSFVHCFSRYEVQIRVAELRAGHPGDDLPVNACALPLNHSAVLWLRKTSWYFPQRTVIYGMGNTKALIRFSDLAVNALLHTSIGLSVLHAVEATWPLLTRGVGDCARVPIAVMVRMQAEGKTLLALTTNVGYGGMAVRLLRMCALPETIMVNFTLPGSGSFSIPASPRWYSGHFVGLQFRCCEEENVLKQWVRGYSALGRVQQRERSLGQRLSSLDYSS
jgi:hypothetical protein